ncbi:hypothetical protein K438DRAFT_2008823, partial [Mycena galopus ATCC 62051]
MVSSHRALKYRCAPDVVHIECAIVEGADAVVADTSIAPPSPPLCPHALPTSLPPLGSQPLVFKSIACAVPVNKGRIRIGPSPLTSSPFFCIECAYACTSTAQHTYASTDGGA